MPQDLTDDKSTLVQVMAWCHQATSHYLSQCWLSSLLPYGIARPQWVNKITSNGTVFLLKSPWGHASFTWMNKNVCIVWYHKISNKRCTKSQNLNDSCLILQLPLPNPLKPGVKLRMTMQLEQRRQTLLQLHLSNQQVYCPLWCALYWRFDSKSLVTDNIAYSGATLSSHKSHNASQKISHNAPFCDSKSHNASVPHPKVENRSYFDSQFTMTPHSSASWVSYGITIVSLW